MKITSLLCLLSAVFSFFLTSRISAGVLGKCGCSPEKFRSATNEVLTDARGLVQGDMYFTQKQLQQLKYRNMVKSERSLWPKGEVVYELTDWRHKLMKWNIKWAMKKLSESTGGCIKFRKATSADQDKVAMKYGNGCYSSVGKIGGPQPLSLGFGCDLAHYTIQHEFIHALGFHHEQARPDRDQHINIHWDNIQSEMCYNFRTFGVTPNLPYDLNSVMHYGQLDFSCNLKWTMSKKDGGGVGGKSLTDMDVAKIKALYKCQ